ncbi:DNA/RNA non-specific endonuclease [Bacillus haynesii]|uniref:DNA/RNA non-specific endonuclease n=1 Tax=Bacillus haynesii TaxID=1925021 RepID=UPI00398FD6A6
MIETLVLEENAIQDSEHEDRLKTDEGGHLIASIFEGSGKLDNLVPMDGNLIKENGKRSKTCGLNISIQEEQLRLDPFLLIAALMKTLQI